MATLNCRLGDGVSSYVVHVAFSVTPDPYPNGATITSAGPLRNVKQGATVTIRASETVCSSGYTFPVYVYTSTDGFTWTPVDYLQSGVVTFSVDSGTLFVRVGPATQKITYYYNVHAFANEGTFPNGATDYHVGIGSSNTATVVFDCSILTTPTRAGYTFLGWSLSANATTGSKDKITFTINVSTSYNSPYDAKVYAVWGKTEYTAYVKLGTGIKSASVYVDGALKSRITDKVYHAVTVNMASTISIKSIAKEAGYEVPYTVSFYASDGAASPSSSFESSDSEVVYSYTGSRVYAVLSAKKSTIDLFYWNNSTWDAANIKTGQPISNLTAARWNRFKAKIQELAEAEGGAYSYASVVSGGTIYATEFNAVRTAITGRSGYGTLPATQSKGDAVKAALFEGSGSLKSALNAAITHYNNS